MAKQIKVSIKTGNTKFKEGVHENVGGNANNGYKSVKPASVGSQGLDSSATGLNGFAGAPKGNQYAGYASVKPGQFSQKTDGARTVPGTGGKMIDATDAIGPKASASRKPRRKNKFQ